MQCVTIDPLAYKPSDPPELIGKLKPNQKLESARKIALGKIDGPEGLEIDRLGNIYAGTANGDIVRIQAGGDDPEWIANTGGRPLGIQLDAKGNLVVCDSYKGLLSIDTEGKIEVLTTESNGVPFAFTDDLDIARDGKIYFSDASFKFTQKEYLYDLLESRPYGRLLVYDPKNKTTTTLLEKLFFANGVALSKNEDFVLVNETYRYRITKYWLKGSKSGTSEIFIDNLPGFPDNITRSDNGEFYLALFTKRNSQMDNMHPSPWKKKFTSFLPKFLWPSPEPYGFVLRLSEKGEILESYQDPSGKNMRAITHAQKKGNTLYLGSLYSNWIGILDIKNQE
ncbi:SMP-30/gluconolactonase/LRE family protein [Leptospira sp. GIMC2001]|uniref:SMP-30/gluconolactonase/LRE family protein n=1 Tax=Leptospira sp. GIMC2001 TaxID=1513297 RepID=UPI002349DFA4|nr:SMP-30/gluconolactonase/LRE family protein [Leptospira sp. GIMC2001]WCL48450.1 SMP-30/gluconolactonase/LRE family protein [Leptospira sp. GIMC2001]